MYEKTQSVNREILIDTENVWENTISKQRNISGYRECMRKHNQ